MQLYILQNGLQTGPFNEQQIHQLIQQGVITLDTMVWYEGLPQWVAYSQVCEPAPAGTEHYHQSAPQQQYQYQQYQPQQDFLNATEYYGDMAGPNYMRKPSIVLPEEPTPTEDQEKFLDIYEATFMPESDYERCPDKPKWKSEFANAVFAKPLLLLAIILPLSLGFFAIIKSEDAKSAAREAIAKNAAYRMQYAQNNISHEDYRHNDTFLGTDLEYERRQLAAKYLSDEKLKDSELNEIYIPGLGTLSDRNHYEIREHYELVGQSIIDANKKSRAAKSMFSLLYWTLSLCALALLPIVWKLYKNLYPLRAKKVSFFNANLVWLWWLCPVVNFWFPVLAIWDLLKGSCTRAKAQKLRALAAISWGSLCIFSIWFGAIFQLKVEGRSLSRPLAYYIKFSKNVGTATYIGCIGLAASLAAVAYILLVISNSQTQRMETYEEIFPESKLKAESRNSLTKSEETLQKA